MSKFDESGRIPSLTETYDDAYFGEAPPRKNVPQAFSIAELKGLLEMASVATEHDSSMMQTLEEIRKVVSQAERLDQLRLRVSVIKRAQEFPDLTILGAEEQLQDTLRSITLEEPVLYRALAELLDRECVELLIPKDEPAKLLEMLGEILQDPSGPTRGTGIPEIKKRNTPWEKFKSKLMIRSIRPAAVTAGGILGAVTNNSLACIALATVLGEILKETKFRPGDRRQKNAEFWYLTYTKLLNDPYAYRELQRLYRENHQDRDQLRHTLSVLFSEQMLQQTHDLRGSWKEKAEGITHNLILVVVMMIALNPNKARGALQPIADLISKFF